MDLISYLDPLLAESSTGAAPTLVEGPMPEFPDAMVALTHYMSQPSDDYVMGPSLSAPGSELESVQVMSRSALMSTAQARADACYSLLDNLQNQTIGPRVYFHITSDGPPISLGQDQNARWRYVANFHCRKQRG
jgi:Bacteriophage minor capsid protein